MKLPDLDVFVRAGKCTSDPRQGRSSTGAASSPPSNMRSAARPAMNSMH